MEFHIELAGVPPDLAAIEGVLLDVDPAAVIDVDAAGLILRVSAAVEAAELVELVCRAGYPVAPAQVVQLPSICCGSCSG